MDKKEPDSCPIDGSARVKIPRSLTEQIDRIVGTFGYTTRGEVVKEGTRLLLRLHFIITQGVEKHD